MKPVSRKLKNLLKHFKATLYYVYKHIKQCHQNFCVWNTSEFEISWKFLDAKLKCFSELVIVYGILNLVIFLNSDHFVCYIGSILCIWKTNSGKQKKAKIRSWNICLFITWRHLFPVQYNDIWNVKLFQTPTVLHFLSLFFSWKFVLCDISCPVYTHHVIYFCLFCGQSMDSGQLGKVFCIFYFIL